MAEAEERSDSFPIKLPSFILNLITSLKPKPIVSGNDSNSPKPVKVSGDGESQKSTVDTVSFPYKQPKIEEPVKFEAEASSGKTSNSLVLWQVYALGGFLVMKWALARWNERNDRINKKETTDDDDQPAQEEDDDHDQSSGHED